MARRSALAFHRRKLGVRENDSIFFLWCSLRYQKAYSPLNHHNSAAISNQHPWGSCLHRKATPPRQLPLSPSLSDLAAISVAPQNARQRGSSVFRRFAESKLFELEGYSWKGSRTYTTPRHRFFSVRMSLSTILFNRCPPIKSQRLPNFPRNSAY